MYQSTFMYPFAIYTCHILGDAFTPLDEGERGLESNSLWNEHLKK